MYNKVEVTLAFGIIKISIGRTLPIPGKRLGIAKLPIPGNFGCQEIGNYLQATKLTLIRLIKL